MSEREHRVFPYQPTYRNPGEIPMSTIYDYGRSPDHWLLALDMTSQGIDYLDPSESACDAFYWMEACQFDVAFLETPVPSIACRDDLRRAEENAVLSEFSKPLPSQSIYPPTLSMDEAFHVLERKRWFVIGGEREVLGVVTRDDVAKPAACAFVLAHLINLERVLRRLLGTYTNVPMPDQPTNARRSNSKEGADEIFFLSQVLNAAKKHSGLLRELVIDKPRFNKCVSWAIGFRNHLAHARSFDTDHPGSSVSFQRFRKIQELMQKAISLIGDRAQVWQAFNASVIVDTDGKMIAGPGAGTLPVAQPAYVITAANPYEQNMSPEENKRRNSLLQKVLCRRTETVLAVIGQSPCGNWQEASFLVSGIPEPEVLQIAERFGQRAVFKLTDQKKTVISTDGREKGTISRTSGTEE